MRPPPSVRENHLLAALSPTDLALLAPHTRFLPLRQGAVLQEAEAPVECVTFPLSGMISLVVIMRDGDVIETATVGREGAIGVFAGFGPWNAFTRAVVQVPGAAVCIAAGSFQTILSRCDVLKGLVLRFKETLLAQVQQTAACNALHALEARLARWLLQAFDSCGDATLPLTQDSLAQMLGVRRTTVSLVAGKLQAEGLIRYRRARIEIVDRVRLQEVACECYAAVRHRSNVVGRSPAPEVELPVRSASYLESA